MWEQLSAIDPPLVCSKDIELFVKYRDRRKFMHFMMGLREDFEPTRASLLSRSPTPSLDAAVKKLISKENHRLTYHMTSFDHVLVAPSPQPPHYCIHCSSTNKLQASHLSVFERYLLQVLSCQRP